MGARGVRPIHPFNGRQHRMIGVQEVASPIGKPLAHGADRHVERSHPLEERVTRDGLDQSALDELDRIGLWMEAPEDAGVRMVPMNGREAVEHRGEGVDQRPALRVIERLRASFGAGAREGNRGSEQAMKGHEAHDGDPTD